MPDEVMKAIPVYVVHLEDPAGSGRAACNGLPFENVYTRIRKGDVLWACTGCTHTAQSVRYWKKVYEKSRKDFAQWLASEVGFPTEVTFMTQPPVTIEEMAQAYYEISPDVPLEEWRENLEIEWPNPFPCGQEFMAGAWCVLPEGHLGSHWAPH